MILKPTTPVEKAPPSSEEPAVKVDSQQPDTEEKEKKERGKTPEAAPAASGEGESGKTEKTKMSEAEAALDKDLDGVSNNSTIVYPYIIFILLFLLQEDVRFQTLQRRRKFKVDGKEVTTTTSEDSEGQPEPITAETSRRNRAYKTARDTNK